MPSPTGGDGIMLCFQVKLISPAGHQHWWKGIFA